MKLLAKLIILVAVFYGGFYFGSSQVMAPTVSVNDQGQVESENQTSLMIDFGDGKISAYNQIDFIPDQTVFDLLQLLARENNLELEYKDYGGQLGVFVESIGGRENDFTNDTWWQYWINNQYAKVGASQYQLNAGDTIEWKFVKGQINDN